MDLTFQNELREKLSEWKAGKIVRTLRLGHPVRVAQHGGEEPHTINQGSVYAHVFKLLGSALELGTVATFPEFAALAETILPANLTTQEREAAESFAWAVLRRGWRGALAGFQDHQYFDLENPKPGAPEVAVTPGRIKVK